jgi:hypothetical protein
MAYQKHQSQDFQNSNPETIDQLRTATRQATKTIAQLCPKEWGIIGEYLRSLTVPRAMHENREEAADLYLKHSHYASIANDLGFFN